MIKKSVMNGFQAVFTFLGIIVLTDGDLLEYYAHRPGSVYHGSSSARFPELNLTLYNPIKTTQTPYFDDLYHNDLVTFLYLSKTRQRSRVFGISFVYLNQVECQLERLWLYNKTETSLNDEHETSHCGTVERNCYGSLTNILRVGSAARRRETCNRKQGVLRSEKSGSAKFSWRGSYTRDIHEPEFLIPRRVLEDGSFDTYSLPNFYDRRELNERKKRSTEGEAESDKLHLVLPFNGIEHHVELTPYHEFISPDMVIETRGAGLRSNLNEALRFKRAPDLQCHYRGFVRGHHGSRAALSLCDGVVGYVHTNHGRYFIEPVGESEPESDGQHVHVAYKRNALHENDGNHNQSPRKHCGANVNWEASWAEQLAKREKRLQEEGKFAIGKRANIGMSGTHSIHRYIEIGLVADRKFLDFHNNTNYEQFLLTVMNMVSDYYHDRSVGNQIDIVVVRMIYLEKEKEEIDLLISPVAEDTLQSFAKWCEKMNPKEHDHPNHFDICVLVTRHDICSKDDTGCDLMGLAYVATACDSTKAACINEEEGLLLGIVIAHEVGHVMGCNHDSAEQNQTTGCKPQDKDGSYFVMSPIVDIFTIRWSPCSRKYINNLLETGLGECLNDNPKKPSEKFTLPNMLPGAMYDANFQCSMIYPGSRLCKNHLDELCKRMWCETNQTGIGGCNSNGAPPAEGTKCGENKWCIFKKCVDMGSRPAAVHGGWGPWGPMSSCTRTCGGGVKFAERECDHPVPANGGRYCIGERRKPTTCNTQPCDVNKPPFRAVQCSLYDKVTVLTDGLLHKWTPFYDGDLDPCGLYCINEENSFVRLSRLANDSTPCKPGTNYMCISGACRKVGCDWVLDSDAIEDNCGICKGTGADCKLVEGVLDDKSKRHFRKIVVVPKGARSIHVVEETPSENTIAVRLEKDEKAYCINNATNEMRSGDYTCADAIAIYLHPEPNREEVRIKGPISQDLRFELNISLNKCHLKHFLLRFLCYFLPPNYMAFDPKFNTTVRYKYYVRSTDPSYTPKYLWDFTEWSDCSTKCGGGTMISEPSCIESTGGRVSPNFCQGIPRPEVKSRTCNTQPCPAKNRGLRWRVSQWSKCSACDGKKGFRHRKVQCVRPAARAGEDDVQANLDACKGRVPRQKEECIGRSFPSFTWLLLTGKRPCRKSCPKKTRNANRKVETEREMNQLISSEKQEKMIDNYVDLSLARYLEKAHGIAREADEDFDRRSDNADFRQLLHDWSMSQEEKKKRRDCVPMNLTTLQPGSIVLDSVPIDRVVLMQAPTMDESLQMNLSDRAFQEAGDIVGMGLDTSREKVYKGEEALKMINEMKRPKGTATPISGKEGYAYDRLASIVDNVGQ
ncbi:A disintegrin and metalloproteinase with thrombospondin motifs 1 [Calliopsis andreniformis]|uniref:A disintegrin and metalloproteinase with thrombospondin motifs 1 n=1 Tax=Calliopsis andreniformis TaxID=337506 RepID=UPI003FCD497C